MVVTIGKIPKLVKKEYRFKKRTKKTMPKLSSLDRKRAEHLQRMIARKRYTPAMLSERDRSLLAKLGTATPTKPRPGTPTARPGTPTGYRAGLWGQKIRSRGEGRGLGIGRGRGPVTRGALAAGPVARKGTIGERITKTPWLEGARSIKAFGGELYGAYKSKKALNELIKRRAMQQLGKKGVTAKELSIAMKKIKKRIGL